MSDNLNRSDSQSDFFKSLWALDPKAQLEVAFRVGAILLVTFYVSGFIVVTVSNAWHGIVGFALFRARVVAAGVLFSVFVAFAILDWSRIVMGRKDATPRGQDKPPIILIFASYYAGRGELLKFFYASLAMSVFAEKLVLQGNQITGWFFVFFLVFTFINTGVLMLIEKWYPEKAMLSLILTFALIAVGIAGVIYFRQTNVGWVLIWFFLVGYAAHHVRRELRNDRSIWNLEWHWILFDLVLAFILFGVQLYPKISPLLGGGKPTPAVLQFSSSSPIDNSSKTKVWFLDEIDMGYYVLRSPEDRKAVFIPRASIAAIFFDADQW